MCRQHHHLLSLPSYPTYWEAIGHTEAAEWLNWLSGPPGLPVEAKSHWGENLPVPYHHKPWMDGQIKEEEEEEEKVRSRGHSAATPAPYPIPAAPS